MFCICIAWLCLVCLLLCKEKALLSCLQLLRRDDMYEVPLSMSLLGFGMGTMLASFHMYGIMLGNVRSSL